MNHRPDPGDDGFDQSARHAWQASLRHVPPGVHRQLRPATSPRRRPALGWPLAAACAAGALAVGLHLQHDPAPSDIPTGTPVAGNGEEIVSAWTALDQAPDFYLWLASADPATLELE